MFSSGIKDIGSWVPIIAAKSSVKVLRGLHRIKEKSIGLLFSSEIIVLEIGNLTLL